MERSLGAHLSLEGGLLGVLQRAQRLGCTWVQIFAGNPRAWAGRPLPSATAAGARVAAAAHGVKGWVLHAIYLVNLASPKPEVRRRSLAVLGRDLVSAERLGAAALVVHPGSDLGDGQGEARLRRGLLQLRPRIPSGCRLLLEGMASLTNPLGRLDTLARLCRQLGPRFGVCLDSAHLCAAGYDLSAPSGFAKFDVELRRTVGYSRVGCVHLNDSRSACGSGRDWHENLGLGSVGAVGLTRLLNHPPLRRVPFILEVPGHDQQGPGQRDLAWLRRRAQP